MLVLIGHKILLDSHSGSASVGRKMGKKLSPATNLRISIPSNSSDLSGQSDSESEHRSEFCLLLYIISLFCFHAVLLLLECYSYAV